MGMFDYVQSEVPLPDGYTGKLQTKSFDSCLTTILIRADGRLFEKDDEYETVPVSERPFPNDPLKQFFGSRRLIKENWRELNFHGDFEFYGSGRGPGEWHAYIARFTHGRLEYIKVAPASYGTPAREPSSGEGDGDKNGLEQGARIAPGPEHTPTHVWPSGADQAQALREKARKGGLRFEAYLPPEIADWLLDLIERDVFTDPSEVVFVILGEHMDLEPHRDLRDELVCRKIQASIDDPRPSLSSDDVRARLANRSEPAVWKTLAPKSGDEPG